MVVRFIQLTRSWSAYRPRAQVYECSARKFLLLGRATVCVSTCSARRYYKRLGMPEMQLLQLAAEESRLSWNHDPTKGVLEVHYAKPPALLAEVR